MGNNSTKYPAQIDPANCQCRKTEFKYRWCPCGRSKPSNEPPTKIRFWIDTEKIRNAIPYDTLEIPEYAKTAKDRDPEYQALVRELRGYTKQIFRDTKN